MGVLALEQAARAVLLSVLAITTALDQRSKMMLSVAISSLLLCSALLGPRMDMPGVTQLYIYIYIYLVGKTQ